MEPDLDAMDRDAFAAALAGVVEHSPWVAEAVWELRPFGSVERLALAFEAAIRLAPQRRDILRAHPELSGQATLTPDSAAEQRAARLDQLTAEQLGRLVALNAAYRERFGFPFISCVREHSVASLLAWGAARLEREPQAEEHTALAEVGKIVALRVRERVAA
ncbi:MAG: 2-oxo-4-hydroxy-4-carboxy-5-ureidoimidazoline decarboxylase [Solirubrobacteraceae bacterium]|jgi:OHCU decarboxylase|nr:2-oxo-4-hydroxy-4-carboxy-5-ureidoimidazoline decarboxylase [Solirubrobacteraceae bacterium]